MNMILPASVDRQFGGSVGIVESSEWVVQACCVRRRQTMLRQQRRPDAEVRALLPWAVGLLSVKTKVWLQICKSAAMIQQVSGSSELLERNSRDNTRARHNERLRRSDCAAKTRAPFRLPFRSISLLRSGFLPPPIRGANDRFPPLTARPIGPSLAERRAGTFCTEHSGARTGRDGGGGGPMGAVRPTHVTDTAAVHRRCCSEDHA